MPKLVDHNAYKAQLAAKAAELFSKHGFNGLGMRAIAAELGISKSALYHYFPTKQALFHACTDLVTQFEGDAPAPPPVDAPISDRMEALFEVVSQMETGFPDELSLLIDYLRGRMPREIADDPTMQLANDRHRALIGQYVDGDDVNPVQCLVLGAALMRYLDGGQTDMKALKKWLTQMLEKTSQ